MTLSGFVSGEDVLVCIYWSALVVSPLFSPQFKHAAGLPNSLIVTAFSLQQSSSAATVLKPDPVFKTKQVRDPDMEKQDGAGLP